MASLTESLGVFFGPSHNERFTALLVKLTATAVAAGRHFRESKGQDLERTVAFEHEGDEIVDTIHELLDNSFILRFDIPDSMQLTDDLDNLIDGMRKVASHIDVYKLHLHELRPDALELMEVAEEMVKRVEKIVAMLAEPRLSVSRVREATRAIDELEARADMMALAAERALVAEYSAPGANPIAFTAWHRLYDLLEEITDDAKHVGGLVLSLARKEA